MHIDDATSIGDHLRRAIREDFRIAKEIPFPDELSGSVRFINNSDPKATRLWWELHAERVGNLAGDLAETQMIWGARTPERIASATGKLKTVALLELSHNFHLGGRNWAKKFTYGPP